jgi:tRNA (guanine-N7-)-methyltransferase
VKHRLFSTAGLTLCASRLADGATLRVVTDSGEYADWIAAGVPSVLACARTTIGPGAGTWFERLWQDQGHPTFHELTCRKVAHPEVPVPEDLPMQAHTCPAFAPERFAPADVRGRPDAGEIAVAWKDRLYDPEARCAMVRATVAEPGLVQHLWLEVRAEADGWHVRPAQGCGFVPTRGIQCALDALRDAVAASRQAG